MFLFIYPIKWNLITWTYDFFFFHLIRFQDVFSEKSFTVSYHGRKSGLFLLSIRNFIYFDVLLNIFFSLYESLSYNYDSKFKYRHSYLIVLQRASTLRLDALGFNLQSVILLLT